jgi:hypothetical protein
MGRKERRAGSLFPSPEEIYSAPRYTPAAGGETQVADLQIEDLISGVATGDYVRKVGSQFGSLLGFDGLMEQYAAFGASRKTKLCPSRPVTWLGQEWSVILAYSRGELRQVNIHTDPNDATFTDVCAWLETVLGKRQQLALPQDIPQSVLRRFVWNGRDGVVALVCTPTYLQVSISPAGNLQESKDIC